MGSELKLKGYILGKKKETKTKICKSKERLKTVPFKQLAESSFCLRPVLLNNPEDVIIPESEQIKLILVKNNSVSR